MLNICMPQIKWLRHIVLCTSVGLFVHLSVQSYPLWNFGSIQGRSHIWFAYFFGSRRFGHQFWQLCDLDPESQRHLAAGPMCFKSILLCIGHQKDVTFFKEMCGKCGQALKHEVLSQNSISTWFRSYFDTGFQGEKLFLFRTVLVLKPHFWLYEGWSRINWNGF